MSIECLRRGCVCLLDLVRCWLKLVGSSAPVFTASDHQDVERVCFSFVKREGHCRSVVYIVPDVSSSHWSLRHVLLLSSVFFIGGFVPAAPGGETCFMVCPVPFRFYACIGRFLARERARVMECVLKNGNSKLTIRIIDCRLICQWLGA